MLVRRYNHRTIAAYLYRIKAYILFHNKQHPNQLREKDIDLAYLLLRDLARERRKTPHYHARYRIDSTTKTANIKCRETAS
jgi:hypothetical protein